jgi:hypothetical protein
MRLCLDTYNFVATTNILAKTYNRVASMYYLMATTYYLVTKTYNLEASRYYFVSTTYYLVASRNCSESTAVTAFHPPLIQMLWPVWYSLLFKMKRLVSLAKISCGHKIISRCHEIMSWDIKIIICGHKIKSWSHEIISWGHNIICCGHKKRKCLQMSPLSHRNIQPVKTTTVIIAHLHTCMHAILHIKGECKG